MTQEAEHHAEEQLRHRHRVAGGRVDHRDTELRRHVHRDVVHAHPGPTDHAQARPAPQQLGRDLGRAPADHRIVLVDPLEQLRHRQRRDDVDLERLPKQALEVRAVEPFREKTASVAFYNVGTPDGSRPGIFYVNLSDMAAMAASTEVRVMATSRAASIGAVPVQDPRGPVAGLLRGISLHGGGRQLAEGTETPPGSPGPPCSPSHH